MMPLRANSQGFIALLGVILVVLFLFFLTGSGSRFCFQNTKPCDCATEKEPQQERETFYLQLLEAFLDRLKDKTSPLVSFHVQGQDASSPKRINPPQSPIRRQEFVPIPPEMGLTRDIPEGVDRDVFNKFKPVLDQDEKGLLFDALTKLSQISQERGFTYMMYSGTLLGSYRHHDIIPWDDDLDIFMNHTKKEQILEALKQQSPKYETFVAGARVKFFSSKGVQTSTYEWKWPYVDISFFKENSTHLWDASMEADYGDRKYVFPREQVFPLHLRPLGGHFYNAPRDSFANLRSTYDLHNLMGCATAFYSHKDEALAPALTRKPCRDLKEFVPFVHRTPDETGVRETLMKGGKIVHTLVVDEPKYAISQPYKVDLV